MYHETDACAHPRNHALLKACDAQTRIQYTHSHTHAITHYLTHTHIRTHTHTRTYGHVRARTHTHTHTHPPRQEMPELRSTRPAVIMEVGCGSGCISAYLAKNLHGTTRLSARCVCVGGVVRMCACVCCMICMYTHTLYVYVCVGLHNMYLGHVTDTRAG